MRSNLITWCFENSRNDILEQWDYEKNAPLLPEQCTAAAGKKVWWKCEKGHSWDALISNRTKAKQGCPFCSGHRILAGFNDLASQYPDLLSEWDYEKNLEFSPSEVAPKSDKFAWWKCDKGHSWQAQIKHRTMGTTCPVCANKAILVGYNDLASTHPKLVSEWDFEKNSELLPTQISSGSNKAVWWKCESSHSWKAIVSDRVRGNGCPYCSKKKRVRAATVSGALVPEREISGSRILEGYNDLATLYPSLLKEWDYEKNFDISPSKIGRGSELKVWWKCEKGHSWQAVVSNRIKGIGCPICSKGLRISAGEKTILYYLKQVFPTAQENYHAEWLGKSELDMFVPDLNFAVEYDGSRWHGDSSKDSEKDSLCSAHGITLVRIRECRCPVYTSSSIKYQLSNESDTELANAITFIFQTIRDKYGEHDFPIIDLDQSKESVYELVYQSKVANSIEKLHPHLLKEWDYEKNGDLKPSMVYAKSKIKVWWRCSIGHSWQAVVHTRANGTGCPTCSGKQVLTGFNDLATTFPDVAAEWHPNKNTLLPTDVTGKSNKKVWWRCKKGHEWEAKINNRTSNGQGCPVCAGQRILPGFNDLATIYPDIAAEWHPTKNAIPASNVAPKSNKKAWWLCAKGHEWESSPNSRARGAGCPICFRERPRKPKNT